MQRLPPYPASEESTFARELSRRTETHDYLSSVPEGMNGKVAKISFICGCHGAINAKLVINNVDIPNNGKYEETRSGPFTHNEDNILSSIQSGMLKRDNVPIYKNKLVYKKTRPIFELEYSSIDVRQMNVTLSTTKTCLGATVSRATNGAIVKQKFINDIMQNLNSTCPTNTLLERNGKYGETILVPHSEYEMARQNNAARKIQRLFTKKKRTSPVFGKSYKTRLMNYDKEKVDWLIDKRYSVKTCDVATINTPMPPDGDVDLNPTLCDAHKLIMIVTKYTASGCKSKKYVILSSSLELDDEIELKMVHDFSRETINFIRESVGEYAEDTIHGRTHGYPSHKITLLNLLRMAKMIIDEFNGLGAYRTVPIDIYDLSCNTFGPFANKKVMSAEEIKMIRMADDYIRRKGISYGGKQKSKRVKRGRKNKKTSKSLL